MFRRLCTNNIKNGNDKAGEASAGEFDAYRQLDKLDFMTAAKILFTTPPKKKFGIDFHLVQFFFACLPSLAVYLVAKYACYEIRRMEAEVELKKKAEEEKKAKEMETSAAEKEMGSDPELLQVKMRLEKLEETVKEIAVESKKQSDSSITKNQGDCLAAIEPSNTQSISETGKTATGRVAKRPQSQWADTINKLKKALPELEKEVRRPSNFLDFYSYAFWNCLTGMMSLCTDIECICELLVLVLGSQFRAQVDSLVEYLKNDYKVINMDRWMGFYRFCNEISFPGLSNYDAELAWPMAIDLGLLC
ncbi:hypothetical protein L1049_004639 [Liquidambar formosana]|uniref:DCUN1 domain-containing protein n=1 Tax=Liquidambar formosana TaxID=63359 RepID=A0AAP0RTR2_LIQFO